SHLVIAVGEKVELERGSRLLQRAEDRRGEQEIAQPLMRPDQEDLVDPAGLPLRPDFLQRDLTRRAETAQNLGDGVAAGAFNPGAHKTSPFFFSSSPAAVSGGPMLFPTWILRLLPRRMTEKVLPIITTAHSIMISVSPALRVPITAFPGCCASG